MSQFIEVMGRIRMIVGAAGVLFAASTATGEGTPSPPALEVGQREFKFRLDPASVDSGEKRAALFRAVAGLAEGQPSPKDSLDAKRCRRVRYLDSEDAQLRELGYVLRVSEKLGDKKCESRVPESSEVTLKRRGSAGKLRESLGRAWAQGAKLEEDLLAGSTAEALVVSVSATAEGAAKPDTVGAVRTIFTASLPQLEEAAVLSHACREVDERRWQLSLPGVPAGGEEPELALWFDAAGEPWLAELSFKQKSLDSKEVARWAADLLAHLRSALKAQLSTAGSKTQSIYACGDASDDSGG